MRIIVAGGGTGGHITPNIAILEQLKSSVKHLDVLYIGSGKGMEAKLVPAKGWRFQAISCGKLRRYFSLENFFDGFRTVLGIFQSLWIVARFQPDVIFCKGGYVSLPVAIAGGLLRKAVIIHESDLEMGLANRIATYFARKICVSFPETMESRRNDPRMVLTGNPVRRELLEGDEEKGYAFCDFKPGKKVLLVMGGSQGAKSINEMIRKNLDDILPHYQILHMCGKGNEDVTYAREGYLQVEFLGDELKDVYAITDLVVSRAGANSLAEFAALGLPAILIPLVRGSRGDQVKNADSFTKNHPALVISDERLTKSSFSLADEVAHLEKIIKMAGIGKTLQKGGDGEVVRQDATKTIVDLIENLSKKHA